jgi:hypothetical protein
VKSWEKLGACSKLLAVVLNTDRYPLGTTKEKESERVRGRRGVRKERRI